MGGLAALGKLLHYDNVVLCVDNIDELLSDRPLIAARVLARSDARIEDSRGRARSIHWTELPSIAARALSGASRWRAARARLRRDLLDLVPQALPRHGEGEGVLVVRTDLWFGLEAGGAVAHTAGVLNALVEQAAPLRLLTSHDVPTLSETILSTKVGWRRYPKPEWSLLAFNAALVDAGKALPRPRFVYQRHSLYGYAGAALARYFGVPLVLEYNGSEVWIGDHWGVPVAARDIALEIESTMLGVADIVTAVSRPLVDQAVKLGADPSRVLYSPNAVDVDRYRPDIDGSPVRARFGLGNALVIGFIGTFGAWHGARLLAEAFVSLKREAPDLDVRLLMIGDGPERMAAERTIGEAGLAQSAVFTGLVAQAEGPSYLAAADILASPTLPNPDGSEFFGSPTKLFEYMAMGRAIVATGIAQIAETLEHERTALLTSPGDVDALARALRRLCVDGDLRSSLGRSAREEAATRHRWAHRADEILRTVSV